MTKSRLDEMEIFAAVAARNSFSAAAGTLGLSPSAVSKLVTRIEQRLGVRLVDRSTHGVSLTAEGTRYAAACRRIVDAIEGVEADICGSAAALTGPLRVSSSGPFAYHVLAPLLAEFRQRLPGIRISLLVSDSLIDLIDERADLALRIGPLADSALKVRRLGCTRMLHVAAPRYLRDFGMPGGLAALAAHQMLGFPLGRGDARSAAVGLATDSGEMLRHLALAGLGIARMAHFHVAGDLAAGRLLEVSGLQLDQQFDDVSAVFPSHRQPAPRVAAFTDFLSGAVRDRL